MTVRIIVTAGRWALLAFAALFVAGVFPFASPVARGQVDGVSGSIAITASPIANLQDGDTVTVHVEAKDTTLYSLTGHICMPGKVRGDHMFSWAGAYCSNVPVGQGEVEKLVPFPGVQSGDMAMKVGVGTADWVNGLGFPYSLTCGPGSPCDLVVRAEVTNSTAYYQIPLCFGAGCPAAAPVPANPTAQQVTTAPPPTTAPTPTTTSAAPPPAPAEGGGGPRSGAATGAGTKATGTGSSTSASTGDLESAQSASAVSVSSEASSRGVRVFVAALAGALGGARVVQVISRERRKRMTGLGTA